RAVEILGAVRPLPSARPGRDAMVRQLLSAAVAQDARLCLRIIEENRSERNLESTQQYLRDAASYFNSLDREGISLESKVPVGPFEAGDIDLLKLPVTMARDLAGNDDADEGLRLAAIPLLGRKEFPHPNDLPLLRRFLEPGVTPALQN